MSTYQSLVCGIVVCPGILRSKKSCWFSVFRFLLLVMMEEVPNPWILVRKQRKCTKTKLCLKFPQQDGQAAGCSIFSLLPFHFLACASCFQPKPLLPRRLKVASSTNIFFPVVINFLHPESIEPKTHYDISNVPFTPLTKLATVA